MRVVVEVVVVTWRMQRSCTMRAHHVNRASRIGYQSVECLPGLLIRAAHGEQRHRAIV
ncbi:hypothetical protein [Burkholderia sp. LMG 21824]|uniref:hypothetical protein n=1 Tax=Burkholderia sp. LMG 21824 TaxID=3158172 RepID=UPI003C2E20E7